METNFFTRQLTEYRVWPTGDKGCLFYVADARFGDEKSHGAVYIIDAPWREGDEVGVINTLHQTELRTLPSLRPVIKGFAAYLLTQDSSKWVEEQKILNKWWSAYCRWCDKGQTENINETEYILEECLNWDMRTKEVMACYL